MALARSLRLSVALSAALLAATPAAADPRWWWNDLRITDTRGDSVTPHVTAPGYASGGAGGSAVFVVWSETDPVQGDLDVWLTASFDGGCTFCAPTQVTDTDVDEITPRVAVLALPDGFWSFAIACAQPFSGQVHVAWDSAHVSYRVPADQLCAQLAGLGPAIIRGDQYIRFGGIDADGDTPDVSAAGTPNFGHFHLAWRETTFAGTDSIRYAHDLTARGGPGWEVDPPRTLALAGPIDTALQHPRIAADLATDPDPLTGSDTRDRSGVNVVWVRRREAGPTELGFIDGLRSTDSGATFSPSGDRIDAPAEALSDSFLAVTDIAVRPALDAAYASFTTTEPAWVTAAWSHDRIGDAPLLLADERYLSAPARPSPDWRSPGDDALGTGIRADDGAPSVALQYRFGGQPSPAWFAWHDARFGAGEIVSRAGMLDAARAPALDLSAHPIPPARPLDTAASSDVQLSHCVVDEATLLCVPARSLGDARDAALDANEMATYAVWSDTRDGNAEIYFKRTDTTTFLGAPRLDAGCLPSGEAFVDVTFDLRPSCPTPMAGERMLRYLIYWRRDPAGAYDNAGAPIEVRHDAEPGPAVTRRIGGLLPGVTYRVIVVPEDEARNVYPASFDPMRAPASAPSNEAVTATPDPCAPTEPCLWRSDVTSLAPHVPTRSQTYLVPPTADDIHLQGAAYDCPVAPGDLEPDASALDNGVPLSLYQVNRPVGTLRLSKSARTIRFEF